LSWSTRRARPRPLRPSRPPGPRHRARPPLPGPTDESGPCGPTWLFASRFVPPLRGPAGSEHCSTGRSRVRSWLVGVLASRSSAPPCGPRSVLSSHPPFGSPPGRSAPPRSRSSGSHPPDLPHSTITTPRSQPWGCLERALEGQRRSWSAAPPGQDACSSVHEFHNIRHHSAARAPGDGLAGQPTGGRSRLGTCPTTSDPSPRPPSCDGRRPSTRENPC